MREAQKKLSEYATKHKEWKTLDNKEEKDEEENRKLEDLKEFSSSEEFDKLHIEVVIASLKQQYQLKNGNNESFDDWEEALGTYITDDDLGLILNCMDIGKGMTRAQLHDYLIEQTKNPLLVQEAQKAQS